MLMPDMVSADPTVKADGLLAALGRVTTTGPVVAPVGTVTTTVMLFQLFGLAGTPLKVTLLLPCAAPKLFP